MPPWSPTRHRAQAGLAGEYQNVVTRGVKTVQSEYLSTLDLASAAKISRLSLNSRDASFYDQRIVGGKQHPLPTKHPIG
jgi:hypothetical protein